MNKITKNDLIYVNVFWHSESQYEEQCAVIRGYKKRRNALADTCDDNDLYFDETIYCIDKKGHDMSDLKAIKFIARYVKKFCKNADFTIVQFEKD